MSTTPIADPWNTLEVVKLFIGVLTPLSVAILGWFISRHLKLLDLVQWTNQKLIEKRLMVYDMVAPQLNMLLCFYTWVGYWKTVTPEDVIKAKRDLDKTMNINRHLFDNNVYEAYQAFIHMLFETYTGPGCDAKILSTIKSIDGDRTINCDYPWKTEWSSHFSPDKAKPKHEIRTRYFELMHAMTRSFGVKSEV
ncbi:MAG: hypothetical protein KF908_04595 [Nitrosomonas sp.]|nr:hypothetical protein [Nitrosomonas sp.]MCW5608258.1 hypothetical protein [Nitrosomonas sp.]